jgi:hypothetical protein
METLLAFISVGLINRLMIDLYGSYCSAFDDYFDCAFE